MIRIAFIALPFRLLMNDGADFQIDGYTGQQAIRVKDSSSVRHPPNRALPAFGDWRIRTLNLGKSRQALDGRVHEGAALFQAAIPERWILTNRCSGWLDSCPQTRL